MREDETPPADRPAWGSDLPFAGTEERRAQEYARVHDVVAGDFEDNELHVSGKVCARCGRSLRAGEDARLTASGEYEHESCPL
jgi:hypothetical protein